MELHEQNKSNGIEYPDWYHYTLTYAFNFAGMDYEPDDYNWPEYYNSDMVPKQAALEALSETHFFSKMQLKNWGWEEQQQ
jgi:hypothetical protein